MPKPTSKKNAAKAPEIKIVADNPEPLKAAMKVWVQSSSELDSDPLGLDEAPQWVENAWLEMLKTNMPSKKLPGSGEWGPEFVGELFGRMQAVAKLLSGEIPMGPEMRAEAERAEKQLAAHPMAQETTEKFAEIFQDLEQLGQSIQPVIPGLLAGAQASSHADSIKFQQGLLRGSNLEPDELTAARRFNRHTRTFFVLALYWRHWVKCKSLRQVHGILCKSIGEKQIGSLKTFEKDVAGKIGMKLRGRGRPPGKK